MRMHILGEMTVSDIGNLTNDRAAGWTNLTHVARMKNTTRSSASNAMVCISAEALNDLRGASTR